MPTSPRLFTRSSALVLSAGAGLTAILAVGCGEKKTSVEVPEHGVILAEVGDAVITPADLVAEAERRLGRRQPVPSKEILLEQMVERMALLDRARSAELDQDPEVVRAIENLLIGKFKERTLESEMREVGVDEEALLAAYEAARNEFTTPAQFRLAILHLKSDSKESEGRRAELRERLEEASRLVQADPPRGGRGPAASGFGALAIRYSDDQVGRYRGGDAGWIEAGASDPRWPAAVVEAGAALEKDEVSPVIEAEGGFYLVKKTDSRPAVTTPFEKAKPLLRQRALTAKRKGVEEAFRDETKSLTGAKIYPEALAEVELPGGAPLVEGTEEQTPPALPVLGN